MKKKLVILLATVITISTFVGCGSKTEKTSEGESKDKTVLTFWCHENEAWVKSYEAMARKFEEENSEYTVEVQSYPYKVYNEKIQTSLTSSTEGPDIVAVWGGAAPNFIATDALSKVPEDLAKQLDEDYLAPTTGIYQKEGTYYGVPMEFNLEYGGMLVNKKLFESKGIAYPDTWEELRALSDQVSESNGNLVEMKGFDMLDNDALICNYLAMILQQGGQYMDENSDVNFATDEGVKAMEAMSNVAFLLDILPSGQWMGPYNTSDMREIFNQTFIDLSQDDTLDVREALQKASDKITSECKISYSIQ